MENIFSLGPYLSKSPGTMRCKNENMCHTQTQPKGQTPARMNAPGRRPAPPHRLVQDLGLWTSDFGLWPWALGLRTLDFPMLGRPGQNCTISASFLHQASLSPRTHLSPSEPFPVGSLKGTPEFWNRPLAPPALRIYVLRFTHSRSAFLTQSPV